MDVTDAQRALCLNFQKLVAFLIDIEWKACSLQYSLQFIWTSKIERQDGK
jgi:hypothetical protein